MTKTSGFLLAVCLLAAAPSMAGNMTFDQGRPAWHSINCIKPVLPESVLNADPETKGNDMNILIAKYNAYTNEAQAYMNCISNEAAEDQKIISQTITAGAQAEIAATEAEVEKLAAPLRGPQK